MTPPTDDGADHSAGSQQSGDDDHVYRPFGEVMEVVEDHEDQRIAVRVKHRSPPSNDKTFIFDTAHGIEFDRMEMEKGSAWRWSEEEILTVPGAYWRAWDVARRRYDE